MRSTTTNTALISDKIGILLMAMIAMLVSQGVAQAQPTAVTYTVTFEATWSAATHPTDFPADPHFSDLIGATHSDQVSFWQTGSLASAGIEAMAELGSNSPFDDEIAAAIVAGDAGEFLLAAGIDSPGQQVLIVQATQDYSLLTWVAMIAPSPDWFIGVSGADLLPGGEWVDELTIDLHAYDAGTDSGLSYESDDLDTDPADDISLLTTSPFDGGVPLGTLTITRLDGPMASVPSMSGVAIGLVVGLLLLCGLTSLRVRRARARLA